MLSSLILAVEQGDRSSAEPLFAMLYSELHRIAKRELAKHGYGVSVSATTLLHEAYLSMSGPSQPSFPDHSRFMAYGARVMRGLIIDHARNRRAQKRGGRFEITAIDAEIAENLADERELSAISDALDALAHIDASLAELVDLKFFCGFSFPEIAAMRGACERTVQRDWEKARIYLHHTLSPGLPV